MSISNIETLLKSASNTSLFFELFKAFNFHGTDLKLIKGMSIKIQIKYCTKMNDVKEKSLEHNTLTFNFELDKIKSQEKEKKQ